MGSGKLLSLHFFWQQKKRSKENCRLTQLRLKRPSWGSAEKNSPPSLVHCSFLLRSHGFETSLLLLRGSDSFSAGLALDGCAGPFLYAESAKGGFPFLEMAAWLLLRCCGSLAIAANPWKCRLRSCALRKCCHPLPKGATHKWSAFFPNLKLLKTSSYKARNGLGRDL